MARPVTSPKLPTPQGVSCLLRNAGFECSAETRKGRRVYENTPGFAARRSPAYPGAVLVDWLVGSESPEMDWPRHRQMLAAYAEEITSHGWDVRTEDDKIGRPSHLIIMANPASLLAAKNGDDREQDPEMT